jgi:hypothetical protein
MRPVFFLFFFLMACKAPQKTLTWTEPATFRIKMERTACYGTCPIYNFTFTDKQVMDYNGLGFVDVLGEAQAEVSLEDVNAIKKRLQAINWDQLAETYPCNESDLPTVILTLQTKNYKKRVEVGCNPPADLQDFINWLDELHKVYMPAYFLAPPLPEEAQE